MGAVEYNLHNLGYVSWVGSVLYTVHLIVTAGEYIDDLDRDLSDVWNVSKAFTLSDLVNNPRSHVSTCLPSLCSPPPPGA